MNSRWKKTNRKARLVFMQACPGPCPWWRLSPRQTTGQKTGAPLLEIISSPRVRSNMPPTVTPRQREVQPCRRRLQRQDETRRKKRRQQHHAHQHHPPQNSHRARVLDTVSHLSVLRRPAIPIPCKPVLILAAWTTPPCYVWTSDILAGISRKMTGSIFIDT